jgi:hypothetical protein
VSSFIPPPFLPSVHTTPCSCLDAGTNPHNNGPAKVYTCYPGTAAQHWYFTGDKRLAITGGDQCLDLDTSSTGRPQTYACTPGNTNQVWTPGAVLTSEPPVPPTTTIVTSTTLSTTPSTTPAPTATGKVQVLHPHSAPSQVRHGPLSHAPSGELTLVPTVPEILRHLRRCVRLRRRLRLDGVPERLPHQARRQRGDLRPGHEPLPHRER